MFCLTSNYWTSFSGLGHSEIYCRENGSIWVFTGPIFKKSVSGGPTYTPSGKIGSNQVWVPQRLYKILFYPTSVGYTAFAFIMRNEKPPTSAEQSFSTYATASLTTIDEIESKTGLDFFNALEDSIEEALESQKATEQQLSVLIN